MQPDADGLLHSGQNMCLVESIGAQWLDTGKRGSLYAVNLEPDPEEVAHSVHVWEHSSKRFIICVYPRPSGVPMQQSPGPSG